MRRHIQRKLSVEELREKSNEIEWIAPFPHSSNVGMVDGVLTARLSTMSRMSLDAAANLWTFCKDSKIVIPGETCFEGSLLPDTTDLMIQRASEDFQVPAGSMIGLHALGNGIKLNNTYLQAKALEEFFGQKPGYKGLIIGSLGYHLDRVVKASRHFGLDADYYVAEDILYSEGPSQFDKFIDAIDENTRKTEKLANLLTFGGKMPGPVNWLMQRAGARIVDVSEDGQGRIIFENTLAKKKISKLKIDK